MKRSFIYLLLGLVSVALIALLVRRTRSRNAQQTLMVTPTTDHAARTPAASAQPRSEQDHAPKARTPQPAASQKSVVKQSPTNRQQRAEQVTERMLQRNVAVNFWGRVLDQNDTPVTDAQVVLTVRRWASAAPNYLDAIQEQHEFTTDSNGRFELLSVSGDVLNLESVQKPGYRLSDKTTRAFGYSQSATVFQPDPQNPVVIHMWKLGPAEPLISTRMLFGFEPDGRPYTLDLVTKKKTEGVNQSGDLIVKFTRSPIPGPREAYTWGLEISAVGGGIIETRDEQTYLAPEAGYQPTLAFQMNQTDPKWSPSLVKDFYTLTRNGTVYGAVHMQIEANYNGRSAIFVEARANPNSSRNLQP